MTWSGDLIHRTWDASCLGYRAPNLLGRISNFALNSHFPFLMAILEIFFLLPSPSRLLVQCTWFALFPKPLGKWTSTTHVMSAAGCRLELLPCGCLSPTALPRGASHSSWVCFYGDCRLWYSGLEVPFCAIDEPIMLWCNALGIWSLNNANVATLHDFRRT